MAIELFGSEIGIYAALACVVACWSQAIAVFIVRSV